MRLFCHGKPGRDAGQVCPATGRQPARRAMGAMGRDARPQDNSRQDGRWGRWDGDAGQVCPATGQQPARRAMGAMGAMQKNTPVTGIVTGVNC
ncbi:MAG: hypothetical protein GX946_11070 [Oligosphaeraceae bacterium]|nr:hypothetical protein [Oligosphaeraceae bacterium]